MICPKCGSSRLKVVDTKTSSHEVIRRRRCKVCGKQFFTAESIVPYRYGSQEIYRLGLKYMDRRKDKKRKEKEKERFL